MSNNENNEHPVVPYKTDWTFIGLVLLPVALFALFAVGALIGQR